MVEFGGLSGNIHDQIPQAFPARNLADEHGHELAPAIEGAKFLAAMVLFGDGIKFMSGKKCNYLPEDGVMMCHWLGSPYYG